MRIPQSDIERVLDATSIEDIVGEFIQLTPVGGGYKARCPFGTHSDTTPSFYVKPSMNIYKCFSCGKGGNAVSFLMEYKGMTYVEAIKYLAERARITLHTDERPMTVEETEREQERQTMLTVNESAAAFFKEQLHADNARARFALDYATKRWGAALTDTAGIGFAPGGGAVAEWAKSKGFPERLLIKLGLLKEKDGKICDYFYNRLVMPIHSRSNQVLGFIARALGDIKPKYINSPDSQLFKKGDIIFGINAAIREAVKEGIIYLVEGAPDVYRLQSIKAANAVASLGTAWSLGQFETLVKYNITVCFIPDIDPPKEHGHFGPGIMAVMKNGKTALKAGLKAVVKEITPRNVDEKADADSYIKSRAILDSIPKVDFIEWYADKMMVGRETSSEKAEVMRDIAEILADVTDKEYLKLTCSRVSKILGIPVGMLQSAKNEVIKGRAKEKFEGGSRMMDREAYSVFGFFVSDHCYYSLTDKGGEARWSNFEMQPLFHIKDMINAKRLYRIINERGHEEIIELLQQDLISLNGFKKKIESLGNYIWEAKEEQLTKLKRFLYDRTETAGEITQLGWQADGFFAFGNGIQYNGQWLPVDEYGIVRTGTGNYYLPAASRIYRNERKLFQFERKFMHLGMSEVSLRAYTDKMIEVFGDNARVGICFLLATLYKDVVTAKTKNFPILNLFGPKGSGKSELGHTLMTFFTINNEPPNLSSATDAALADTISQCANALVHIDEYKNTIELSRREFIKGLYDGVGRTRMNMDRDKKRETTAVDCGVILSGQEIPTIDIAIFSRMIYLTFERSEFSAEAKCRFDELKNLRNLGCTHLTLQLLSHRKRVEAEFANNYNAAMNDVGDALGDHVVEDRIYRNWVTPLAIFRTLSGVLDINIEYRDMLRICVDGIIKQNSVCKTTNEIASFWQIVDYLHQNGEIFNESDYRIKYELKFKGKGQAESITFQQPRPVLYLCTKRIMMLYRKNGKMIGEATLPAESLRHYLENSKEYLGVKNAVRFKNCGNPQESMATETGMSGFPVVRQTSRIDWALAFDYGMLVEKYGINLEVETVPDDAVDPTDIDENETDMPY